MSLLTINSLPAERARGLAFIEQFRNAAEVAANGGTVYGTPTISNGLTLKSTTSDYILYALRDNTPVEFTFITFIKINDITRNNYIFVNNSGAPAINIYFETTTQKIRFQFWDGALASKTVYSANTLSQDVWYAISVKRYYVGLNIYGVVHVDSINGTPANLATTIYPNASNYVVGKTGTSYSDIEIKQLRFFKTVLDDATILAYANGTMWNYMDNAVLVMDGRAKNYDPTNTMVKDVSGNGNDLTLGDGATSSTYPTKLTKIGYSFDGGDYAETSNSVSLPDCTFSALVKFDTANLNCVMSFGTGGDLFVLGVGVQTGIGTDTYLNFGMFSVSWKLAATTFVPAIGKIYFMTGVKDGTTIKLYLDGILIATNTVADDLREFPIRIGRRFDAANNNYFNGNIYYGSVHNIALNQMQIIDLQLSINPNSKE